MSVEGGDRVTDNDCIISGSGFTVLCYYLKLNKCCHCSIICLWDIWLLSDQRKCFMIMGFCMSVLFQKKKKKTHFFKDLNLLTLRKKRSFKKFYYSLPIAVLIWLSIRGKYYLQHIKYCLLHMKGTMPDALNGHN